MKKFQRTFAVLGLLMVGLMLVVAGCNRNEEGAAAGTTSGSTTVGNVIDDGVITAKVKSAFLGDENIKSLDIKVETRKGEVQLSGFIGNQNQIERAITITRGVEGVKSIDNKMMLKEGSATVGNAVDDSIITTRVRSALLGDASVKSTDITVVTRKGQVQLSGFVDNQVQIDRVTEIARRVEGVQTVISEMSIKK